MALGKGLNSLLPQQKGSTKKAPPKPKKQAKPAAPSLELETEKIWQIPLTEITANPDQPRKHFGQKELEDLVASIKKHGVMQPITVTEQTDGCYEIIAGERRFRASQLAGLATIPALVRQVNEQEKLELALIENIQRQQLNPIEEAFAYQRLIQEFSLTQQQVADQVGKSRSVVANTIRLLDLPAKIQKALVEGQISTGKARALLSLKSEDEQLRVFASMMGEHVTVRDVERAVAQKGASSRKGSVRRDPNIMAQEDALQDQFGTKVHISQKGEKGSVSFDYYSAEELAELLKKFGTL